MRKPSAILAVLTIAILLSSVLVAGTVSKYYKVSKEPNTLKKLPTVPQLVDNSVKLTQSTPPNPDGKPSYSYGRNPGSLPDLYIMTYSASADGNIISYTVTNIGEGAVDLRNNRTIDLRFDYYKSSTTTLVDWCNGGISEQSTGVQTMGSGTSISGKCDVRSHYPPSSGYTIPAGKYDIVGTVDINSKITEDNENNNKDYITITVS